MTMNSLFKLIITLVFLFMYKCEVTNENFISSNTTTDVNNNPFVKYFGEFLYKWNENKDEITIQKTEDLLKNKNTVAIYYSASWCGPCKQFTPLLAKFYEEMNKKGKKFEIIWVSRDQSTEDFVAYYQYMPWLAVPVENIETCMQLTSDKFQLKGIPHLVILDGFDASIYTLDGRTKVSQDKYGLEFPWRPRNLMNILPRPVKSFIQNHLNVIKLKLNTFMYGMLESIIPKSILHKFIPKKLA